MVRLLLWLALLCVAAGAQAQPSGQRFVSIAFHDVDDKVSELETDAVTTQSEMNWLFDRMPGMT